jgi:hypothetical protein
MPNTTYGTAYAQSSDLVSNWPGVSSSVADRLDDVSFKGNGLNDQTGTTYTLVLLDAGKTVTLNNAAAVTVTVPTNASVAYETGTCIYLTNKGAGTVTVSPAGGVTLNNSVTLAQHSSAYIQKLDTNTWVMVSAPQSGLNFITSVTFSAATSTSVNNVFTSTYDWYRILIRSTSSVSNSLAIRMRVAGVDATAANYTAQRLTGSGATADASRVTAQTSGNLMAQDPSAYNAAVIDIFHPAIAEPTIWTSFNVRDGAGTVAVFNYMGGHSLSTAYDGFTLLNTAGNNTGVLRVYGYRNS